MRVILLSDVRKMGKKGEIVEVNDGFAKNFLFPKKFAKLATENAISEIKILKENEKCKYLEEEKQMKQCAEKINEKTLIISAKGGKNGKLFGSVTSKNISDKLNEVYGVQIEKRKIHLTEDIKNFGTYKCEIKFKFSKAIIYVMITQKDENIKDVV